MIPSPERRSAPPSRRTPLTSAWAVVIIAVSLILIGTATLVPQPPPVNPIPRLCLLCGDLGTVDFVLNIVLFVPLGLGLAVARRSVRTAILVVAGVTLAVEFLQISVIQGRDASLGDLLANTLGGAFGFGLWRVRNSLLFPRERAAARLSWAAAGAATMVFVLTAAALRPSAPQGRYWVQVMPIRAHLDPFDGTVLEALANDRPLAPAAVVRSTDLWGTGDAPLGLTVEALVTAEESPQRIAPIVRLARPEAEAFLLGRHGDALAFRVRTRAADWLLRTPVWGLPGAFARSTSTDTTHLAAHVGERALELSARSNSTTVRRETAWSVGVGWALLLPFDVVLADANWPLTVGWMACLLLPAAYWGLYASASGARAGAIAPVAAVVAGIVLVPWLFGFVPGGRAELLGAGVGLAAGAALVRVARARAVTGR